MGHASLGVVIVLALLFFVIAGLDPAIHDFVSPIC
jgi:hypothetical protein